MRLAPAIHWAAWADVFQNLHARLPTLAGKITDGLVHGTDAPCLQFVRDCVSWLHDRGFHCPAWVDLQNGARPEPIGSEENPAHFRHGWQFYATQQMYKQEHLSLPT